MYTNDREQVDAVTPGAYGEQDDVIDPEERSLTLALRDQGVIWGQTAPSTLIEQVSGPVTRVAPWREQRNIQVVAAARAKQFRPTWMEQLTDEVIDLQDVAERLPLGSFRSEYTYAIQIALDHIDLVVSMLPKDTEEGGSLTEDLLECRDQISTTALQYGLRYPESDSAEILAVPIGENSTEEENERNAQALVMQVLTRQPRPDPASVLLNAFPREQETTVPQELNQPPGMYLPQGMAGADVADGIKWVASSLLSVLHSVRGGFLATGLYPSMLMEMISEHLYFIDNVINGGTLYKQQVTKFWSEHVLDHQSLTRQLLDPADKRDIAIAESDVHVASVVSDKHGVTGACGNTSAPHSCSLPFAALAAVLQRRLEAHARDLLDRLPEAGEAPGPETVQGTIPPLLVVHTILESQYGAIVMNQVAGTEYVEQVARWIDSAKDARDGNMDAVNAFRQYMEQSQSQGQQQEQRQLVVGPPVYSAKPQPWTR